MGKLVSELSYAEAVRFHEYLLDSRSWVKDDTSRVIGEIIARGPEPDRPEPIAILPPTIIEGGQHVGKP